MKLSSSATLDTMDIQDQLLNWALSATVEDRLDFLHKYLKVIPAAELENVIKKANAAKKRVRRTVIGNDKEKIQKLRKKLQNTACSSERDQILNEIKEAEERRRLYEDAKTKRGSTTVVSLVGARAVSSEAQAVPAVEWKRFPMNDYIPGTCFEKYFPTNYVFLDCETVLKNSGDLECGSVALLNHNRDVLYKTKVFHSANSFKFNSFTMACNGFYSDSLADAKLPTLDEVSEKVEALIENKLVIIVGGDNAKQNSYYDLISLKLDASKIAVYNLHFHFYKTTDEKTVFLATGDEEAAFVIEPISLRRLSMKFFNIDIQSGIHDPETDALYTARIFQEILPLKLRPNLQNFVEYDARNFCAYEERYIDFDHEPKMRELRSRIRAEKKRKTK